MEIQRSERQQIKGLGLNKPEPLPKIEELSEKPYKERMAVHSLMPHHKSMARALVCGGKRPGELAKMYHLTASQVSNIIKSPLFQAELGRLEALSEYEAVDVATELSMRLPASLEAIDRALMHEEADKAAKAAFEILDRLGHGKKSEPQQHLHLHAHEHKEIQSKSPEELLDDIMTELQRDND